MNTELRTRHAWTWHACLGTHAYALKGEAWHRLLLTPNTELPNSSHVQLNAVFF